jgi:hypothetical protein
VRGGVSLQIVAVSLNGGVGHEHIAYVLWQRQNSSGVTTTEALIRWLREDAGHEAWLASGERRVAVEVVTAVGAPSHVRSRENGHWGDELLKLARF